MSDTSQSSLAFVPETAFGVTPATPAFQNIRYNTEALTPGFETAVSDEIRADATVANVRRTGINGSGDIAFELHRDANFETLIAAACRGVWASGTLKGGVQTPSFTFERKIFQPTQTAYMRFTGVRVAGMSLNLTPADQVTGTFKTMIAGHPLPTAAIITGATYAAPTPASQNPPMMGVDVSSLQLSGAAGVDFTSLTIDVELNLRMQRKVGAVAARGIGYGRRMITGTAAVYFDDLNAYTNFMNQTRQSVIATVSDGTNSYTITLPRIVFLSGETPNPGNDNDFILTMNYQAEVDATLGTDIQIVRA